jgi:uncharacterized protein YqfB (UPF0267 family)
MGLYNFKERFTPRILDGSKTHTIRPKRAIEDKPGNTLHLYTGLRTKKSRLLMRVSCVKIEEIAIEYHPESFLDDEPELYSVTIDGVELDRGECEAFARRDGFENFADMMNFWQGRLPFRGQIVHWKRAS